MLGSFCLFLQNCPVRHVAGFPKLYHNYMEEFKGQLLCILLIFTPSQVLDILIFIRKFLDENPFTVCSEELAFIKKELITDEDEIKTKQKAGVVSLHINVQGYFVKLKCRIPNEYPEQQIR